MSENGRVWRWTKRITLAALVPALLCSLASRPKLPGTLGGMATELRVGMTWDEATNVIRTQYAKPDSDYPSLCVHIWTHDGRQFNGWGSGAFDNMPPPDQIAGGYAYSYSEVARYLSITFGEGGILTKIEFKSDSIWEELRYSLARGTGWGSRPRITDRHQCFESVVRCLWYGAEE